MAQPVRQWRVAWAAVAQLTLPWPLRVLGVSVVLHEKPPMSDSGSC